MKTLDQLFVSRDQEFCYVAEHLGEDVSSEQAERFMEYLIVECDYPLGAQLTEVSFIDWCNARAAMFD